MPSVQNRLNSDALFAKWYFESSVERLDTQAGVYKIVAQALGSRRPIVCLCQRVIRARQKVKLCRTCNTWRRYNGQNRHFCYVIHIKVTTRGGAVSHGFMRIERDFECCQGKRINALRCCAMKKMSKYVCKCGLSWLRGFTLGMCSRYEFQNPRTTPTSQTRPCSRDASSLPWCNRQAMYAP